MSVSGFVIALTVAAALLALWAIVRFPRIGPETLTGALVQVGIAFLAGALLVPTGMSSALAMGSPEGPLMAVFLFALPALLYLFLATLWAMRVLQQMLSRARR
jgi:hypothetical protein